MFSFLRESLDYYQQVILFPCSLVIQDECQNLFCIEYCLQGYPFLSLNIYKAQHEPFSVSYFKWCELWNNCEVMKEIVVYTTATQASDPPVLQKTTYMGWSKFPHLRTAFFFFLKTNTKWAWRASPALTCTFQSAVDTRLR